MTKVQVLAGFNEPDGTRHEAGEIIDLEVIDFGDLTFNGTIRLLPDEPPKTDKKPFKPTMETKEQGNE